MYTLISFVLTAVFIIACQKILRNHPLPFYAGAAVISAAVFILQLTRLSLQFPPFIYTYIWPLFFRGGIAGAFFVTVMWTGAVPVSSKRLKQNMPIRGELSILACILAIGHGAANALTYFRYLFTDPGRMSADSIAFSWCSIIMIIVMIPLFVTSFKSVRRRMKASKWKKLQRMAYVFYGLMFAHVSLLYIPFLLQGMKSYWLNYMIYCFVYVSYAVCRIFKAILKNVNVKMLRVQIVGNVLAVLITALTAALILSNVRTDVSAKRQAQAHVQSEKVSDVPEETEITAQTEAEEIQETQPEILTETQTQTEALAETQTQTEALAETQTQTEALAETQVQPKQAKYVDGTYSGTGSGYEGPITLEVTIEEDRITWIEVTDNIEDPEFFQPALSVLEDVINAQHTDLDAVSGATYSSYGLLDAVDDALSKAKQ